MFSVACAIAAASILAVGASGQDIRGLTSFDFGWKQKEGVDTPIVKCDFPVNESSFRCDGLQFSNAQTPLECESSCCVDPSCLTWQWEDPATKGGGCWIGEPTACTDPSTSWIGGSRPAPGPQPHPNATGPAARGYDDSNWTTVQAPHDFLITGTFSANNSEGNGFLPRNASWYRKNFSVPSDWQGKAVWVRFDGAFHTVTAFVNSVFVSFHASGYTSFLVRIDNGTNLEYGGTQPTNVLALDIDATSTSSWWYAGGGLYRHVHIFATAMTHIVEDGVYTIGSLTSEATANVEGVPTAGATADASLATTVELGNEDAATTSVKVTTTLIDTTAGGAAVGSSSASTEVPASSNSTVTVTMPKIAVPGAQLWSVARPYVYTVNTTIADSGTGAIIDSIVTTVGFRSMEYGTAFGFKLNGEQVSHTGFCDHNNQDVFGMAVPDRAWLHRLQMLRAIGGNARRMSHNAPSDVIMDLADTFGILTMPENRNFKSGDEYARNWHDLLKHDRSRPSVAFFSECNEVGCYSPGDDLANVSNNFKVIARAIAPATNIVANQFLPMIGNAQAVTLDVQGFSHQQPSVFEKQFAFNATEGIVASECCSCENERDQDTKSSSGYTSFNADCVNEQTNWALNDTLANFTMVGTYTWTLADYFGEGHSFPEVGSSYGQFDRSLFAKQAAHYYRSAWLTSRPSTDPGRPSVVAEPSVIVVESWDDNGSNDARTVHAYCGGDGVVAAQLTLNGKPQGSGPVPCAGYTYATFTTDPWTAGTLMAEALDASGTVLASFSTTTSGAAASIELTVDAPSPTTGTGSAMLADGQDIALIRATLRDSHGSRSRGAVNNVTFAVSSGPAVVLGCGNGDPTNRASPHGITCPAFHGLVRSAVRVTQISTLDGPEAERFALLNGGASRLADAGIALVRDKTDAATSITVMATSPGMQPATVTIQLSSDPSTAGVMAVAAQNAINATLSIE